MIVPQHAYVLLLRMGHPRATTPVAVIAQEIHDVRVWWRTALSPFREESDRIQIQMFSV